MSGRELVAAVVTRSWEQDVCHYCGVTDAQVDGDRRRWVDGRRTVCSAPSCILSFRSELDRAESSTRRRSRRRSPAEIHELILDEAKNKRRQYREAAKRRKGSAA